MAQLALFEGSHLPRTAAREALSQGDLGEARAQLERVPGATEEATDAARLERIISRLGAARENPVGTVHDAFASTLAGAEARGFLTDREWFALYARQLARALDAEPGSCFRGWLGAHFALAAGDVDGARRAATRLVESQPPGTAWIEAARLAFELGEASNARDWIHAACLDSVVELAAAAPILERCGVRALDASPSLPPLPDPVEDLFEAALALDDLPGPRTRWVAVLGEIDRVLAPRDQDEGGQAEGTVLDGDPRQGDAARAFLAALRAARRSRERDRPRGPERCSDRELRARRRMQRLAPALLARYLQGLRGVLL